ncbi:hypothetical protein Bca101_004801 [Brassica carinata]
MHASSYQINIATAQQVAKENSPPEDCTRDWCLTVLSATITTRPMVCTVTQILDSNTGKKTWQKATESSVPRMVGNLVYGVSPVSAAFSFGRRDFYALFVEEGLDLSSIHRKKVSQESFQKVIKLSQNSSPKSEFDPDFSLMEHEQEGNGNFSN